MNCNDIYSQEHVGLRTLSKCSPSFHYSRTRTIRFLNEPKRLGPVGPSIAHNNENAVSKQSLGLF